jgi:CheY-like chemotaxis protein
MAGALSRPELHEEPVTARAASRVSTILLVEDDDAIRESVSECLALEGYHVALAVNGAEALDWLERGDRPAVVLLDMVMPVMTGAELLVHMRRNPMLASVPVVLMTAAMQKEPASISAQAFLPKPFDLAELLRTVARFCDPGRPR